MPLLKIKEDKNMNHNHEYHSNKPEIKANVVYRDGNIAVSYTHLTLPTID